VIEQLILRNILRNRKSSLIILILILIITFVFFIGNSIISRTVEGLREVYINGITGDVVIEKSGDITMNLFGANIAVVDDFFTIPDLPAYNEIADILANDSRVIGFTSQVSSKAFLDLESYREPVLICGVATDTYFHLFSSIELVQGEFLKDGEFGAMISMEKARSMEKTIGRFPEIGAKMLLTSGGAIGFKIREAPLVGIFQYKNAGQFMNEIILTDPRTARALSVIQTAVSDVETSQQAAAILDISDVDALFGDSEVPFQDESEASVEISPDAVQSLLRDTTNITQTGYSDGGWNFLILRLKETVSAPRFINELNRKITGYGAIAIDWQTAAGESAATFIIIQTLFNSGLTLVIIVGVMAIINILLISIFKRKREIGTLRSVGASDWNIRSLILGENIALSCVAGFAGVFIGVLLLNSINNMHISIPNRLLASLLGGQTLTIGISLQSAVSSLFLAVAVGLAASLYPVEAAVLIRPVDALRDK
jgi:ABC-type lipoprotein release transport system permease subunit